MIVKPEISPLNESSMLNAFADTGIAATIRMAKMM